MIPILGLGVKWIGAIALAFVLAIYGPDSLDCPTQIASHSLSVHWPWCENTKEFQLPSDEGVPHESDEVPTAKEAKAL